MHPFRYGAWTADHMTLAVRAYWWILASSGVFFFTSACLRVARLVWAHIRVTLAL